MYDLTASNVRGFLFDIVLMTWRDSHWGNPAKSHIQTSDFVLQYQLMDSLQFKEEWSSSFSAVLVRIVGRLESGK